MARKLLIVSNKHGHIIASGPTKVKKSNDGPNGLAFEPIDDQHIHEVELSKDALKLSSQELFASFRIRQKPDVEMVDIRPKSIKQ